jgi:hypothetical protein
MAQNKTTRTLTITAAGVTQTFPVTDAVDIYDIKASGGTVVLAGNVSIAESGTPTTGTTFSLILFGGFTLGAFTFTVFGTTLTAAQVLYKHKIFAYYNGTTWDVYVTRDSTSGQVSIIGGDLVAGSVVNAAIATGTIAITKMAVMAARGYIPRAGVNGVWEAHNAATSGQIVMGDGTDVKSTAVTGDVTISGAGVTTIGAGKVTAAMLNFTLSSYLEVSRTYTTAEVLTLYSSNTNTGIQLLAAPGAGKYYEFISVSAYNNYNTATYAAGANLLNVNVNAVAVWTFPNAFIEATVDTASQGTKVADAIIALNTAVMVQIATADPTLGNGSITVSAIYRVRTV